MHFTKQGLFFFLYSVLFTNKSQLGTYLIHIILPYGLTEYLDAGPVRGKYICALGTLGR